MGLLDRLLNKVTERLPAQGAVDDSTADTALALGVMLLHVAHADSAFDEKEREFILTTLKTRFGFQDASAENALIAAEIAFDDKIEIYSYVREVKESASYEKRLKIVEGLCVLGLAEGGLIHAEEEAIKKLANLMDVSMQDYGKVKGSVIKRTGG